MPAPLHHYRHQARDAARAGVHSPLPGPGGPDGSRPGGAGVARVRLTAMTKTFEAVYEDGVLRPLESLDLRERQRVRVMLQPASPRASQGTQPAPAASGEEDWLDAECLQECAGEADERISLDSVRQALSKIPGSLTADFVQERADR